MRSLSLRASSVLILLSAFPAAAQQSTVLYQGKQVIAKQVILRLRNNDQQALARVAARLSDATITPISQSLGVHVIKSDTNTVETLMSAYGPDNDILYAEPNYVLHGTATPNDSQYSQVWGVQKVGAPAAWDTFTGSKSLAVGVIDTGVDYTHPDLGQNVWSAPVAYSVNVAGRTLTCPAGSHGFNAIAMSCDPKDDNSHGTHVSGTIGAVGNNNMGVAGINWTTQIVGIKFLDSGGSGSLADALNGIEFAIQLNKVFASSSTPVNIRVLSASWGSTDFSQSLLDELNSANNNGMLFVAAAGNSGSNNDSTPFYPAGFSAPNVIAVAATDSNDTLASFSNYGSSSVHLSAPGVNILSTVLGGGYAFYNGTSMATPHVAGAALLTLGACPALTTAQLKSTLLGTVDSVSNLQGKTITGGRLNVSRAIQSCRSGQPPSTGSCTASVAGDHWRGEYFNNMSLTGSPLMVRDDGTDVLNFDWGNQGSAGPACNMPGQVWSARWTRSVAFSAGTYRFNTVSDDGMRMYVDGVKVLDRWFDQGASLVTTDVPMNAGTHTIVVEYYQNQGGEKAAVSWQQISSGSSCVATVAGDHWKGEYFNNMSLSGSPLMVRDDGTSALSFNWGNEGSPNSSCNIPGRQFSTRWTRTVSFSAGTYAFTTSTDDGMRLYIDGTKLLDRWFDQSATAMTTNLSISGGTHTIVVEYYQNTGGASAAVNWQLVGGAPPVVTSVVITAPSAGATVSGTVMLSANASTSGPATLVSVQFLLDNGNQGSPISGTQFNMSLDTTRLGNGTHTLTAIATDSIGNTTTSSPITIMVNNVSAAPPAAGPLLTSFTPGSPRSGYTGWLGLQFTVGSTPLTVNSLGRLYIAGNNRSHVLKLVNASNGNDVPGGSVTVTLPAGSAGQFAYAQLVAPLTLAANTAYYLVSQEISGGDQWYDLNVVTATNGVSVNGPVFWTGASWYLLGIPGETYVPVNLMFR